MASEEDDGVSFKATNEDGRTEKRNGTATFEEKKLVAPLFSRPSNLDVPRLFKSLIGFAGVSLKVCRN